MSTEAAELAYSLPEFCRRAKIGRTKLYEEVRAGRLTVRKLGKKNIVTAEEGRRYLETLPTLELPNEDGEPPSRWTPVRRSA